MTFDLSKRDVALNNLYKRTLDKYTTYLDDNKMTNSVKFGIALSNFFNSFYYFLCSLFILGFFGLLTVNLIGWELYALFTVLISVMVWLFLFIENTVSEIKETKEKYKRIESEYNSICKSVDDFISVISDKYLTLSVDRLIYDNLIKWESLADKRLLHTYLNEESYNVKVEYAELDGTVKSVTLKCDECSKNVDIQDDIIFLDEDCKLHYTKKEG